MRKSDSENKKTLTKLKDLFIDSSSHGLSGIIKSAVKKEKLLCG